MVKLRLRRKGRTHHPVYDIIATDGRKKRDGVYIERLGFFDPHHQPSIVQIDADRAIYWLNVGAQPTDLVNELLSYEGVLLKRHLQFKGKTESEIQSEIEKHRKVVLDRYFRRQELRKKRKETREKEKAETIAEA